MFGVSTLALVATGALLVGVTLVLGYVGRLRWLVSRRPSASPTPPTEWPSVDVIVPVYNERQLVDAKLRNLAALDYQHDRLRFWIVDGGSDDGTLERVEKDTREDGRFTVIRFASPNKVWQLSSALKRGRAVWVLVTDADARLPAETLRRMVTEGAGFGPPEPWCAPGPTPVLAVGSSVRPVGAHPLERLYWRLTDWLRLWESRCGCASIVTGPCYLFRRDMLDGFPQDVVADDVHVALAAAARGGEVRFVELRVEESRCPRSLPELYRHKVRKADAYLKEVFRFLPRWSQMNPRGREVFAWRAAHLVVIPPLSLLGAVASLAWIASTDLVGSSTALAVAGGALGVYVIARRRAIDALLVPPLVFLLSTVLWVALLKHPFSSQTANYKKIAPSPTDIL